MADRYCRNCGHELGETDRFCPNCASPVQDVAHVPTPEADVPVPPPPQQAGGTSQPPPQQAAAQPQGRSTASKLLIGCAALVVLPLLFVGCLALLGGGGGGGGDQANSPPERNEQDEGVEGGGRDAEANQPLQGEQAAPQGQQGQQQPPAYTVGQTAKVGNVEWRVTDAYLTNQLRSGFGTQNRGRFVVVDFTFTNNRPEEVTLDPELHMILKDSQGREFGSDPDAWEFVPTNLNIFLEPVNPGLSKDGRAVYQVPPDANGFRLTVDDVELMEDKSAVFNLSNLRPRAYDPASASATATATAGQ